MHRANPSETSPPAVPFGRAPYRTREWKELREQIFRRDCGCCRACREPVRGKDWRLGHERPHGGDEALFWDSRNLLLVCKRCSEAARRAGEPRAFADEAEPARWPTRPAPHGG